MTAYDIPPGTQSPVSLYFSNDAKTSMELVAPANPLPVTVSGNISGNITGNVTATPLVSGTLTATQVTVPATANGILILASNSSRKGATISNPGTVTVYVQQAATGVTTSNGFGIPGGQSYNIDAPLYTGAVYGIVATATQVVTVVELT